MQSVLLQSRCCRIDTKSSGAFHVRHVIRSATKVSDTGCNPPVGRWAAKNRRINFDGYKKNWKVIRASRPVEREMRINVKRDSKEKSARATSRRRRPAIRMQMSWLSRSITSDTSWKQQVVHQTAVKTRTPKSKIVKKTKQLARYTKESPCHGGWLTRAKNGVKRQQLILLRCVMECLRAALKLLVCWPRLAFIFWGDEIFFFF